MSMGCNIREALQYLVGSVESLWSTAHLGHCSRKWHPFKLFHLARVGALMVDLLFQALSPHPLKSIERLPLTLERWEEGNTHCERQEGSVLAWEWPATKHGSPQLEEWDLSPQKDTHTGVSAHKLGAYTVRGSCPSLRSPNPFDQISSSCSTGASALSSLRAPACSFAWTLMLGGSINLLLSSPYCALFASSCRRCWHLLLTGNHAGKKPCSWGCFPKDLNGSII